MEPGKKLFWQVLLAVAAFQALSVFAFWTLHHSLLIALAVNIATVAFIQFADGQMAKIAPPGFVRLDLVPILALGGAAALAMTADRNDHALFLLYAPFLINPMSSKMAKRPIRRKKG
jgi:hypothetical protein